MTGVYIPVQPKYFDEFQSLKSPISEMKQTSLKSLYSTGNLEHQALFNTELDGYTLNIFSDVIIRFACRVLHIENLKLHCSRQFKINTTVFERNEWNQTSVLFSRLKCLATQR